MGVNDFIGFCTKTFLKNCILEVSIRRTIVLCVLAAPPLVSAVEISEARAVDGQQLLIEGAGFGIRPGEAAPVLMDFAEYAYENGVLNEHHMDFIQGQDVKRVNADPDTLWIKSSVEATPVAIARPPRLERLASGRLDFSEAHYLMEGANSFLGWPAAYGGFDTPVDNQRLYVSWFMKPKYNPRWYWSTTPLSQRGEFVPGEAVIINGIRGTFIEISDVGISAGMLQFILPGQGNANNLAGQKMVGLNSGAELTFHTDFAGSSGVGYLAPGSNKYLRVWEDPNGREGIRLSWTNGQITQSGLSTSENSFSADVLPGKWNFMELFIDLNAGSAIAKVNGKKEFEEYFGSDKDVEGKRSPTLALLGFNGKIQVHQRVEVDDVYMDHRFSRVLIGDKPNFSDLESYKLQVPVEWSDNRILIKPGRNGIEFPEAAYLYVVNGNGDVNENGFPLCASCVASPNAPPSVRVQ
jgi:hypothetical protein